MSDTLQIEKSKLLEAYKNADKLTQDELEKLFGPETFAKGFPKSVAEVMGEGWDDSWDANSPIDCYALLRDIISRINGGWEADWSDSNQPKYYLYFRMHPFSLVCVDYCFEYSDVPSRLCFRTRELATEFMKVPEFVDLYKTYMSK